MTVSELLDRMSAVELSEWQALSLIEHNEAESRKR